MLGEPKLRDGELKLREGSLKVRDGALKLRLGAVCGWKLLRFIVRLWLSKRLRPCCWVTVVRVLLCGTLL